MIDQKEALTQALENSDLFKTFSTKLHCAIEDAQFSVELRHPDIDSEAPSSYALVSYLRSRGYTVEWKEFARTFIVSWF